MKSLDLWLMKVLNFDLTRSYKSISLRLCTMLRKCKAWKRARRDFWSYRMSSSVKAIFPSISISKKKGKTASGTTPQTSNAQSLPFLRPLTPVCSFKSCGFCMVWSGLFQTGDELLFLLFSRNPFVSNLPQVQANRFEVFQRVVLHQYLHHRWLAGQIPAKQTCQRWKMVINWVNQPRIWGWGLDMFEV